MFNSNNNQFYSPIFNGLSQSNNSNYQPNNNQQFINSNSINHGNRISENMNIIPSEMQQPSFMNNITMNSA